MSNPQADSQLLNFLTYMRREPENLVVNGYPLIDQINGGVSIALGGTANYLCDNWGAVVPTGVGRTGGQSTDVPEGQGFQTSIHVTIGTGATPAAAEANLLYTSIESFDFLARSFFGTQRAVPMGLGFWVKSSIAGVYSLYALGAQRYITTFDIYQADVWEFKIVYLPPNTSGAWGVLQIYFDLGSGTNFDNAPINEWTSTSGTHAPGSVSLAANSGAVFKITGLQVRAGYMDQNFPFESYPNHLIRCQRLHPVLDTFQTLNGYAHTATTARVVMPFLVKTRASITGITTPASFGTLQTTGGNIAATGVTFLQSGNSGVSLTVTCAGGLVAGQGLLWRSQARVICTGAALF